MVGCSDRRGSRILEESGELVHSLSCTDAKTGFVSRAASRECSTEAANSSTSGSADKYDARERKIRRLASPKEDADATSKNYVDLALRAARKDEIEHRENVERITSQLRKDADEAGQGLELLFARLVLLEREMVKRLDAAESAISRIDNTGGGVARAREKKLSASPRRGTRIRRSVAGGRGRDTSLRETQQRPQLHTVIDALSKYAWAVPLKSKSANEVARALSKITRNYKRCPKNLQTDKGKEFYNTEMRKFAKEHGVNHYSTYSVMKASIVERFNRTLKNSMWKYFTLNGTYKWIDALPRLIKEYNARKHRTIGMRPVDVTPAIADKLLNTVYSNVKIAAPAKFKLDDPVRVSKFKTIFEKGFTPNWTTEIFRITKVQRTNPVTYLLKDSRNEPIAGGFYEHELLRVSDPDVSRGEGAASKG
ncbi:uncharacterized protein LOC126849552 [Cataglyphis hispanica]|uniref:uncharacterized protein LOC126849552 n=1 Tax=Cataglyphis hispanica TaxID=1086592 RepID=UPI0021801306|nr:uncharacterized protein LOC126849552 [Cataglyphis hispanica]